MWAECPPVLPLLSIPSPSSSTIELGPLSIHFYGLTLLVAIGIAGYRYIWRSGPVLDVGAGAVAIHFPRARVELADGSSPVSSAFTNVYPALKVHVGWAF